MSGSADSTMPKRSRDSEPLIESKALGKDDMPLLGREESLKQVFIRIYNKWRVVVRNAKLDKADNPIVYFPASPGTGKTRILDVLTRKARKPTTAGLTNFLDERCNTSSRLKDAELKWALLELMLTEEINQEFVADMRDKTVGIALSFNSGMDLLEEERRGGVSVPEMLGRRIMYVFQGSVDRFQEFVSDQHEGMNLKNALDHVQKSIGEGKYIILAIDELLLGAGMIYDDDYDKVATDEKDRIGEFLRCLGFEMDQRKTLFVVCTSLSFMQLDNRKTSSGRPLLEVNLRNLSFEESKVLAMDFHERDQIQNGWLDDESAMQIVRDCNGAPRLLEQVFRALNPGHTTNALRGILYGSVTMIAKMRARSSLLCAAIVFAMRGEVIKNENERWVRDKAMYSGHLGGTEEEPVFPLLVILIILGKSGTRLARDDPVKGLWEIIKGLAEYDPGRNEFSGVSFEGAFNELWKLRYHSRLFQIFPRTDGDHRRTIVRKQPDGEGNKRKTTIREFLTTLDVEPDIAKSAQKSAFDVEIFHSEDIKTDKFGAKGQDNKYSKLTKEQLYNNSSTRILLPLNTNEKGLDDIKTFKVCKPQGEAKVEVAVFAMQYKFSNPDSSTKFSLNDVKNSFINTIDNNSETLRPAIEAGLFGFIFVAHREDSNVSACNLRDQILGDRELTNLCKRAADHICIMNRKCVQAFIPQSFRIRPQFKYILDIS